MASSRKTRRRASSSPSEPARVHLEIVAGPGQGTCQEVPEGELRLGRASGSDFRINSDAASRHHATLFKQGDLIVLRDENSHNGTYVNEEEILGETELTAGDRIQIGDSVLCLVVDGVRERAGGVSELLAGDETDESSGAAAVARRLVAFLLAIAGGTFLFIYLLPRLGFVALPSETTPSPPPEPPVTSQPAALAATTGQEQGPALAAPPSPAPISPAAMPPPSQGSAQAATGPMPTAPAPSAVHLPPPASAAAVYRQSAGRMSARKQEEESRRQSFGANRSREERRARKLYLQGDLEQAIEIAEEAGAMRLVGQLKNFRKAEGAARAAFSFKKGTEAIQHYEEAFALDEEIGAGDDSGLASVPGRRVSKALSDLYQQAGEVFLKKSDLARAETFLERSLDYDSTNARSREALKKLRSAAR